MKILEMLDSQRQRSPLEPCNHSLLGAYSLVASLHEEPHKDSQYEGPCKFPQLEEFHKCSLERLDLC